MSIEKIDHLALAKKKLAEQYKNSNNLVGYLNVMMLQTEELENVLFDLLEKRSLETAEGEQLNVIGRLVGLDRNVFGIILDDDTYRLYLKVKILKNHTRSTIQELTEIYIKIFEAPCHIFEYAGGMILAVGRELTVNEKLILTTPDELGRYIFPKVLGIRLEYVSFDPDNVFAYVGFPNAKGYGVGKYAGRN